jgi:pSer/pThr/pTyr-binding forkhead associated (FHA) protein
MDKPFPTLSAPREKRSTGPQGTRFFSKEDLRQFAAETGKASRQRASVRKPVLQGVSPELGGRRFFVETGRHVIGRLASNDIVVNDPSVSSSHAWIINQQGRCSVMNTLSTNGTFVNDVQVHRASLKHGDRVRFGHTEFVFLTRDRGAPSPLRWHRVALGALVLVGILGMLVWLLV